MHGPQNVGNVVLGNLRISPEYPSFYPEDLIGGRQAQWLYVCHWCFRYTHELMKYAAHCVSFFFFWKWVYDLWRVLGSWLTNMD
jgi:hypothetical protein